MKNNLKKTGLTILSVFLLQLSYSQENFIPGYVILGSDTLHGLIDYRNWEGNPDKIRFKEMSGDKVTIYTPAETKGFSVQNELYESAVIETDISPNYIENETDERFYDPEPVIKVETAFLQTIYKGEKSLYHYLTRDGKDQFYIKQDSSYILLIHKKYLTKVLDVVEKTTAAENNKYINQLILYLQSCPALFSRIRNTTYTPRSLEKLFISYQECTQSKTDFHKKAEKTLIEYGILAGASMTSLDINGLPNWEKADKNISTNFAGGLFLEIIPPRNQRKWSLCNELLFTSYNINANYEENTSSSLYTTYNSTVGISYLKINNMIRYKYPVGNSFIYANAGISNGFGFNETSLLIRKQIFNSSEHVSEEILIEKFRKYEQGYILGIGAKHKNYSCEIRYERGNGISKSVHVVSKTQRLFFLLGFKF